MNKNSDKALLILDLDETLIHSTESSSATDFDFTLLQFKVYKRPFLDEFIRAVTQHYLLAVWSSASDAYVDEIIKRIIPPQIRLEFAWGRSKCAYSRSLRHLDDSRENHFNYVKDLKKVQKLGFNIDRMLIVDDSPEKVSKNYGNAIYPSVFEGDKSDRELELLRSYLISIAATENYRKLEKRDWRRNIDFNT